MPTSPKYFDLLTEEEDHPETVPQPASKPQNAAKTVRFAEPPQVNNAGISPGTTTATSGPHLRQTKQKKG